jgi:cell division protein FtsQ
LQQTIPYNKRKIVATIIWSFVALAVVFLFVFAARYKNNSVVKGIKIDFAQNSNNFFIEQQDVIQIITQTIGKNIIGESTNSVNIEKIEHALQTSVWIANAQVFFNANNILEVRIAERMPIARVFTNTNYTFYLDSTLQQMPISDKFADPVPVFTNVVLTNTKTSKKDLLTLQNIKLVAQALIKNKFCSAVIDQVECQPNGYFEMVPKIGKTNIILGDAIGVEEKLNKLQLFYAQVMPKENWNKYSSLNLQFDKQVVAKIRDAADFTADSLAAINILQQIAANAERNAVDSSYAARIMPNTIKADTTILEQSNERDEEQTNENAPLNISASTATVNKSAVKQPSAALTQPKPSAIQATKPKTPPKPKAVTTGKPKQ